MKPKVLIIGSTGKLGSKLLKYTHSNNIKILAEHASIIKKYFLKS